MFTSRSCTVTRIRSIYGCLSRDLYRVEMWNPVGSLVEQQRRGLRSISSLRSKQYLSRLHVHANGCFKSEQAMFFETLYYHINSPSQALHLIGPECLEKAMLSYRFRARYAVSSLQSELTNSAVRYVPHICRISLVVHPFTLI